MYGATGSGKSTMARRLSQLTGIPWISVDDICWRPGWVSMPLDQQLAYVDALTGTDSWIRDLATVGGATSPSEQTWWLRWTSRGSSASRA